MKKIFEIPFVTKIIHILNKIVLPGFQGVTLGRVTAFFIQSLTKGILLHRAAAMTYRIFIAIIPIIMALFSIISFLGDSVKITILNFIESMVPAYVWPAISNMITEVVTKQNGTLLSFSFLFGIILVLICVNSIINILNATYFKMKKRTFLKQLAVACIIISIWTGVIILSVGVFISASAGIQYIDNHVFNSPQLYEYAITTFKWLLLFFLVYIFISSFYYFAPTDKRHYRFFSVGSTFACLSMVLILGILNFYFSHFGNYNVLYGSLGAILAILLWIYWNSVFILIGFDLNVSIVMAKRTLAHTNKNEFNCLP